MAQAPSYCQDFSRSRGFASCLKLGIFVLGLSCLGCWQEVRYEPGEPAAIPAARPTGQPTDQVVIAEVETPPQELLPPTGVETFHEDLVPKLVIEPSDVLPVPALEESAVAEEELTEKNDAWIPSPEIRLPEKAGTGLAAWEMSSRWSMAAARQAKGQGIDLYGTRLERARDDARLLGVELPELPLHEEDADRLERNLTFLLEEAGPQLAIQLGELHGADHAALVELATKTNVLLLNYSPNSPQMEPVIGAIRQAAESSGLPKEIWNELIDLLTARKDFKQVKAAIFQLHQQASAFLGGESG